MNSSRRRISVLWRMGDKLESLRGSPLVHGLRAYELRWSFGYDIGTFSGFWLKSYIPNVHARTRAIRKHLHGHRPRGGAPTWFSDH